VSALLAVRDLDVHYGRAHVLQGVSFEMGNEPIALIGRNGMGKTTLCNAIMHMPPGHATGSIQFEGRELVGRASYKVAGAGIGYVPQGRRLFESLTVDEHLRMAAPRRGGRRWTIDAVYELFPRLAERRGHGGMQLSGGEQQMLAIGRALLTNPRLLILDEATEGLAPIIREEIWKTIGVIRSTGIATLIVDKTVAAVTSIADRVVILVKGEVVFEDTPAVLLANPDLMHRHLGV
jgi:branched-chain amino acid transport system ATP-binding protein